MGNHLSHAVSLKKAAAEQYSLVDLCEDLVRSAQT